MTNKERLELNNLKIEQITKKLKSKVIDNSRGEYFVKVIDYDGTILAETNLNTGDTFELPTPPTHEGLVFQEWSCSQEIVDNTITIADNNVMVGPVYTTASGLMEIDVVLTKKTGLSVTCKITGTKDWGDGTSSTSTAHTYTDYGEYTIKCDATAYSSSNVFGQTTSNYNYYCVALRNVDSLSDKGYQFSNCKSLKTVTFSKNASYIDKNMFYSCSFLETVIIPNSVQKIDGSAFYQCGTLKNVVIGYNTEVINTYAFANTPIADIVLPNKVKTLEADSFRECRLLNLIKVPEMLMGLSDRTFSGCSSLTELYLPNTIANIGANVFENCSALKRINLSTAFTNIGTSLFAYCYSLREIVIPSGVSSIENNAFGYCYGLMIYDFSTHTTVPTLASTGAFGKINALAKIIVPDNLYDEWIAATNWATYADYIYKASEVEE